MRRKRNKKGYLAVAALMAVAMLWMLPIKAEADCTDWRFFKIVDSYCATPICHTGDRTSFVTRQYYQICSSGCASRMDYKIVQGEEGCCPYK